MDMTYRKKTDCSHQNTVTVVTGGLERVICEDCGDVTVRDEVVVSKDIDRSMFLRKADTVERAKAPSETLKSQH